MKKISVCLLILLLVCTINYSAFGEKREENEQQLLYYMSKLLPVSDDAENIFLQSITDNYDQGVAVKTSLRIMDVDIPVYICGRTTDDSSYHIMIIPLDDDLPKVDNQNVDIVEIMCPGLAHSNPMLSILGNMVFYFAPMTSSGASDQEYCLLYLVSSEAIFQDHQVYQVYLSFDSNTHYLRGISLYRIVQPNP